MILWYAFNIALFRMLNSQCALIRGIYYKLIELFHDNKLSEVNYILDNADFTKLSPLLIMSIIRTTAIPYERPDSWAKVRDRACDELDRRRLDTKAIMHGLLHLK